MPKVNATKPGALPSPSDTDAESVSSQSTQYRATHRQDAHDLDFARRGAAQAKLHKKPLTKLQAERRRERNRESAQRFRAARANRMQDLSARNTALEQACAAYKQQLADAHSQAASLQSENTELISINHGLQQINERLCDSNAQVMDAVDRAMRYVDAVTLTLTVPPEIPTAPPEPQAVQDETLSDMVARFINTDLFI